MTSHPEDKDARTVDTEDFLNKAAEDPIPADRTEVLALEAEASVTSPDQMHLITAAVTSFPTSNVF